VAALAEIDVGAADGHQRRAAAARWSASIDDDAERAYQDLLASGTTARLGAMAAVDIGVVTGANAYFIMSRAAARHLRLPPSAMTPILERPTDAPGLILRRRETRVLLDLRRRSQPPSEALTEYLAKGEADGISERYKCRVRRPWWAVPLPRLKGHAMIPYMSHHGPRLIVNEPGAWGTNLVHAVRFTDEGVDPRVISAAMLSAGTLLSAEVEGRAYGGGVLKLETKEAERLLVPVVNDAGAAALVDMFRRLDRLVRLGRLAQASAEVDAALGLEHERFATARAVYRDRRLGRKAGSRAA
jgi:hypothetical protein